MDSLSPKDFLDDLLKKRMIYIYDEVSQQTARDMGVAVLWLNALDDSSEITLYINSGGGGVSAGLDIYDIVRHSKAPVTGIVYKMANSMATVILQACRKRKILKNGVIIIHNIKINKEWHEFEEDLEKALDETKRHQQAIYEIFAERTGKPIDEIKKICREAKTMTACEAKELGFIDEII